MLSQLIPLQFEELHLDLQILFVGCGSISYLAEQLVSVTWEKEELGDKAFFWLRISAEYFTAHAVRDAGSQAVTQPVLGNVNKPGTNF